MSTPRRKPASRNAKAETAQSAIEPAAFEEALRILDETVTLLEDGKQPLEETLRLYERGIRAAQRCQELLDKAELRVQKLSATTDAQGDWVPELEEFLLEEGNDLQV